MAWQEPAREGVKIPEYLARKGQGKMSKEEVRAVVQNAITQCVQFVDTELSVERARATEYYLGKPFGNEEEGRSQVILTEVRDATDGMLPSLLRVFFGSEHAVEFVPTRADTVPQAAQATDYVRYVFEEENAGFLQSLQVLKDGLVRKIGVFKWGWDDSEETTTYRQEGIDRQQLELLAADDDVELGTTTEIPPEKGDPNAEVLYDVEFTRTIKGGKPWVKAIPPEEFFFNRQTRSLEEALVIGHRTDKTRGELLAMGIKAADIDEHAGAGNSTDISLMGNAEEIARRDVAGIGRVVGFGYTNDPEMGPANAKILYTETLMALDENGDGIAEWRKITTIGPAYYPVEDIPADDINFAVFTPFPEPHTLVGGSLADRTMDAQKINSSLLRGTLDSLSASLFPRTVYRDGQVSVADLMNTALGAPIRTSGDPNSTVRNFEVPFVGKEALPILGFMQDVIERRTGQNKGPAGLDADALQSTGKEAVGAVLTGSQQQIEMVARVFAEMTLKPMFRGLLRMLIEKQPRAKMVRLRGQWVEVDPRAWDETMDVTVNVALGTTFIDKKIATLMAVAQDQTAILTQLGPENPVVTLPMLRNTKAKILELQGLKDVDSYYLPLPPNWQPPPPPPPQPTPEQMAMQGEQDMNRMKAVKELAIRQDELSFEMEKWRQQLQFQYDELSANIVAKRELTDAQFAADYTQSQMDADIKEAELTIKAHSLLQSGASQEGDSTATAPQQPQDTSQFSTAALGQPFGGVRQREVAPA